MFLGDLTLAEFRRLHWRRRPLHVRDGAERFLGSRFDRTRFERLVDAIAGEGGEEIVSDPGGEVTFAQRLDRASPPLAERATAIGSALDCSSAWIDGVLAADDRSIGCHYDHSDNFVVQQEGVKLWSLHDPSIVPADELARRLRNAPGLGAMYLPDDHLEFVLEPGDVLYIPLFWVHRGVSRGPSLSLSVVCNASVDDAHAWRCVRSGRQDRLVAPPPPEAPSMPHLDEDRIHGFFEAGPAKPPDPASLVLPQGREGPQAELMAALSRSYLRRLLLVIVRCADAVSDPAIAAHLCAVLRGIQALDDRALEGLVTRPELTSWTARATEALNFRYSGRIEEVALHLGAFVLPAFVAGDIEFDDRGLLVLPTSAGTLDLLALDRRVGLQDASPAALAVKFGADELRVGPARGELRVPRAALVGDQPDGGVKPLQSTAGRELTLVVRHRWFDDFLPRGRASRISPIVERFGPAERDQLIACLDEGLGLLRSLWWSAWDELDAAMSLVMPLHSEGLRPHNESIPAFRGLVRTSARPSYLAAQTLVHETGHNRLNSILELEPILASDRTVHHSPFVGEERPMLAILHGIFAFTVDAHITARVRGKVAPIDGAPIEPYLERLCDRLAEAHRTLEAHADLTESGERLRIGLVKAFEALA